MLIFLLILIFSCALVLSWNSFRIYEKIPGEIKREKPKVEPFITPTNPAFVNQNMAGQGDSIIVTPKSPQLIEFEEQEEIRKLQLGIK